MIALERPGVVSCGWRENAGLGGSSKRIRRFAQAQSAAIRQAVEAGDMEKAVMLAAGTPWAPNPTPDQVQHQLSTEQGRQTIVDKIQGAFPPGYAIPIARPAPAAASSDSRLTQEAYDPGTQVVSAGGTVAVASPEPRSRLPILGLLAVLALGLLIAGGSS